MCDYTYCEVNSDTEPTALPEAMQFGYALPSISFQLAYSDPTYGPVHMGQFDLADDFDIMPLAPKSAAPLAALLQRQKGQPQLGALPLTATRGWTASPPAFLGAAETIADLANARQFSTCPYPGTNLRRWPMRQQTDIAAKTGHQCTHLLPTECAPTSQWHECAHAWMTSSGWHRECLSRHLCHR